MSARWPGIETELAMAENAVGILSLRNRGIDDLNIEHLAKFSDRQIAAALVTAGAAIYARIVDGAS